jgi:hypothetical protein
MQHLHGIPIPGYGCLPAGKHAATYCPLCLQWLPALHTGLLEHLQWPLLSTRITNFRLTTFYKAVNNLTAISTSHLRKHVRTTNKIWWNDLHVTFLPDQHTQIFILSSNNCRLEPVNTGPTPKSFTKLFPACTTSTVANNIIGYDTSAVTGACYQIMSWRLTVPHHSTIHWIG